METLRRDIADGLCLLDADATDMPAIFEKALAHLTDRGVVRAEDAQRLQQTLERREAEMSTAIGHAVALPHAYVDELQRQCVVFIRLRRPVNLGAPDGVPTRFVFLMLGPKSAVEAHLDSLTNIARLMSDEAFRYEAGQAGSSDEILGALKRFEARTAKAKEKPEVVADDLLFTGRIAGGVIRDIQRKLPFYGSDFRDGASSGVLASITFLVFACLAPAVTFGGLMALGTEGHIGAVEMIVASAVCGVIYALVSAQPLIVLGGTGPLLVFTVILFGLCKDLGVPFLPTYAYVGLWTGFFVLLMALTDLSALMRFFTRFTDEIFAALISLIFIFEALTAVGDVFVETYSDPRDNHDKAFLSLILTLGTFFLAMSLSRFRRSRYLLPKVREFLADFGPTIAIGLMTIAAVVYRGEVNLEVLRAPSEFGPTMKGRSWFVNPFEADLPAIVWFGAPLAALFGAILLYLDQNITSRIVNSPDHKLGKGGGYHLDLAVVGALVAACSLFGLPWLVAATVRSLNHVRSLATVEEAVAPDGGTHERVVHVRENRVSGLAIHLVIGVSLLALPLIKLIPIPVLHGLFLFMGVVSIKGNQFFERISLWLMDPKLYPSTHYVRRVNRKRIHLFTFVQAALLALLWLVKTGPAIVAILFPLFIALIAPVRLWLGRFFDDEDLKVLDAESEPEEEAEEWV